MQYEQMSERETLLSLHNPFLSPLILGHSDMILNQTHNSIKEKLCAVLIQKQKGSQNGQNEARVICSVTERALGMFASGTRLKP